MAQRDCSHHITCEVAAALGCFGQGDNQTRKYSVIQQPANNSTNRNHSFKACTGQSSVAMGASRKEEPSEHRVGAGCMNVTPPISSLQWQSGVFLGLLQCSRMDVAGFIEQLDTRTHTHPSLLQLCHTRYRSNSAFPIKPHEQSSLYRLVSDGEQARPLFLAQV